VCARSTGNVTEVAHNPEPHANLIGADHNGVTSSLHRSARTTRAETFTFPPALDSEPGETFSFVTTGAFGLGLAFDDAAATPVPPPTATTIAAPAATIFRRIRNPPRVL
jgi:hypothetical protein